MAPYILLKLYSRLYSDDKITKRDMVQMKIIFLKKTLFIAEYLGSSNC